MVRNRLIQFLSMRTHLLTPQIKQVKSQVLIPDYTSLLPNKRVNVRKNKAISTKNVHILVLRRTVN